MLKLCVFRALPDFVITKTTTLYRRIFLIVTMKTRNKATINVMHACTMDGWLRLHVSDSGG